MQSNGISRLLARRIEGMAFPLQRVAFPAIQHRSSFARHDLLPRCSRAFHAAAPVRSGEGMSEGAFTRLVDDCLEDLYGNLEARAPSRAARLPLQAPNARFSPSERPVGPTGALF